MSIVITETYTRSFGRHCNSGKLDAQVRQASLVQHSQVRISVLEYKNQRKQIFGKHCYKKWVGEEEVAWAGAMNQLGKVAEGESQRIQLFLHEVPAR